MYGAGYGGSDAQSVPIQFYIHKKDKDTIFAILLQVLTLLFGIIFRCCLFVRKFANI
ncbi:hypothetical protein BH11BAC4_BH11BAC4_19230 [soil metagenome]